VVVAVQEAEHRRQVVGRQPRAHQVGRERADQQRGRGAVPVVDLVPHLQRLGDEVAQVERPSVSSAARSAGASTRSIQRSRASTSSS